VHAFPASNRNEAAVQREMVVFAAVKILLATLLSSINHESRFF